MHTLQRPQLLEERMTIVWQIPWRLTRRSIPALAASALIGAIAAILLLRAMPRSDARAVALAAAVGAVFTILPWLAWCAFTWHVERGRESVGPYYVRYAGLIVGVAMWSAQSWRYVDALHDVSGWEMNVFGVIFAVFIPAPFALWGGVVFRYAFDSIFGSRAPRS